jgi:hypothetical protein
MISTAIAIMKPAPETKERKTSRLELRKKHCMIRGKSLEEDQYQTAMSFYNRSIAQMANHLPLPMQFERSWENKSCS